MRWGPTSRRRRVSLETPRAGPRGRVARTTTTTTTTTGLCRGRRATRPIVVSDDGTIDRRHRGATERRRREHTRGVCRAGLETVGSVVASQSPGLGPALLVNSSVFLFGMPVLLKGLTDIATASAWFLGTVRFLGDSFVRSRREKVMT